MRFWGILFLLFSFLTLACENDTPFGGNDQDAALIDLLLEVGGPRGMRAFQLPENTNYSSIPQDPRNPLTKEKIELGAMLFHENDIGSEALKTEGMYTYSCATCHHAAAGFQAGVRQGIGEGGLGFGTSGEARIPNPIYQTEELDVQPIRTPSAMNVAWQELMLWNGQFGATGDNIGTEDKWDFGTPKEANFLGYHGVETQAIAGMTVHRLMVDSAYVAQSAYKQLFDAAFPEFEMFRRYTKVTAGLAIAAYERTILANEAPFQKWLGGDLDAMTERQKEGAMLFFGKANCVSCHKGPALNAMDFYALGMNDLEGSGIYGSGLVENDRLGRGGFTGKLSDYFKFKVPQLYNLKDSPFYGHGGTFTRIRDVISYKNEAQAENTGVPANYLSPEFAPLQLQEAEIDLLTEFVEEALYDPSLARYTPAAVGSGFCYPNNDTQSRIDLGCQ